MKKSLRKNMITRLQAVHDQKRRAIEQSLCTQLLQSTIWKNSNVIGITHATPLEWNTTNIMQQGWRQGKEITVPKTNPYNKTMDFYAINGVNELVTGYANILEPNPMKGEKDWNKEIDLLIIPGLMFDQYGYRLGFGGGFYDRYLARVEHATITVSLAAEFQLVANLPMDDYDIPVDYIITEHSCMKTIT